MKSQLVLAVILLVGLLEVRAGPLGAQDLKPSRADEPEAHEVKDPDAVDDGAGDHKVPSLGTLILEFRSGMLRSSILHPRNQIAVFVNGEKRAETKIHAKIPFFQGVTRVNFDSETLEVTDVPRNAEVTLVAYENSFPNIHASEVGRVTLFMDNMLSRDLIGLPMKIDINSQDGQYIEVAVSFDVEDDE